MLHNQTHKLVHSSAMYYQNLIIIHECSKKLLKMKNSNNKKLTPSTRTGYKTIESLFTVNSMKFKMSIYDTQYTLVIPLHA